MSMITVSAPGRTTDTRRRSADFRTRLPNWLGVLGFILLHVGCAAIWFTGTTALALSLCAICYLVNMVGITVGYHRYFSHRAFKTSRTFQFVLACLGCTAFQKGPLWWAAHHRHHHRHSDTPEDLHSPRTRSLWWSHAGWVLASDYNETNWPAIQDLSRYPELRWLNRNHWIPPLVVAVLCLLIGGWSGLIWGFIISTMLSHHAVFTVNSLCHLIGRRRYATPDQSRNNLFVAFITLGEGWHNNHHHYQSSANQGFFWWEIDVSYYLIQLLGWVGLVWDIRKPPRSKLQASAKKRVDPRIRLELLDTGPRAPGHKTSWYKSCKTVASMNPYFRSTAMTNHESPGVLRSTWTAIRDALNRGILGRSSQSYLDRINGGSEYWDRVIAAQGWRREQPLQPKANRFGGSSPDRFDSRRMNDDQAAGNTDSNGTKQTRESNTDSLRGV